MTPWNFQLAAALLGVLLVLGMQMAREKGEWRTGRTKTAKRVKL